MNNCSECGGDLLQPLGINPVVYICKVCGKETWAIVDPSLPEPTPEEIFFYAQNVELIFELGGEDKERNIDLSKLRNYVPELRNEPTSKLFQYLKGNSYYSFGSMPRSQAIWHIDSAEKQGIKLKIRETNASP